MILVLFGTQDKPFKRMLDYILQAINENIIPENEKIYIQIGEMKYNKEEIEKNPKYKNIEFFVFKSNDEFQKLITESEYIITHAGAGTMVSAASLSKKMIIIPRKFKNKEHVNDHQMQLAQKFTEEGYGLLVQNYEDFKKAVSQIKNLQSKSYKSNNEKFCENLDKIINELL